MLCNVVGFGMLHVLKPLLHALDARFRNPPIGGFKHVECTSRNAMDCFITENLVLPVMYDSVQSVLVKQHGYIRVRTHLEKP